jgi:GTP cyclohydrolase I
MDNHDHYETIKSAVDLLLDGIGHPKDDPNILETPDRVAKMFQIILSGYNADPKKHLKTFPSNSDEMVIVRNIPFYSYCAHHIQPFYGKFTIAYKPQGEVLGLSKLVRIAREFSKKLQVQEDLTADVANFIYKNVKCTGVGVNIRAQHMCMVVRGVRSYGAETITTKLLGEFKLSERLQTEFYQSLSDKEGY